MKGGIQVALLTLAALTAQAVPVGMGSQKITSKVARELLAPVCASGAATGTCTPCPAFTGGQNDILTPNTVIYGHFTDARATDALVDMSGCEPHVNNFGGSLLMRWQGLTNWKLLRYVQGLRSGQCLNLPAPDGRDQVLCQSGYAGMGTMLESLSLMDLKRLDGPLQILFTATDDTEACLKNGSLQSIVGWRALPAQGRASGLEVRIRSATYTRADPFSPDDPCAGHLKKTPSRVYHLTYTLKGSRLTLRPESKSALAALKRDNPDFGGER